MFLVGLTAAATSAAQPGAAPAAADARDAVRRPAPPDSAARARYVGQYALADSAGGADTPLRVFEQGGALFGQLRTNTPTRLVFLGGDAFRPAAAPEFTITFAVADGRATAATVRGPGTRMRGPRDSRPPAAAAGGSGLATEAGAGDASRGGALYDQVARLDSLLFDASYVRCDTAAVNALLADDVEFYHDLTGLHRGAAVRADFARLAAQCPRGKGVRRELVPGTLRVYRMADEGAVETGEHRFVEGDARVAVVARFVHVWRREAGPRGATWRASRILSLDHHTAPLAPTPTGAAAPPAATLPSGPL